MKTRSTFPPLVILILAALLITTSPSAAMPERGPSASGFGEFRFFNSFTNRGERWSFSFEATANKNGKARGRAQFDNLTAQTQVVVRINCLNAGEGHAVMTGRVLHSDDPFLPKSENVVFAASDSQASSFRNTITPLFPFFGDCTEGQPLTILPVEGGEIRVEEP